MSEVPRNEPAPGPPSRGPDRSEGAAARRAAGETATGLAIGMAVGAMPPVLPRTETEDRPRGETRDNLARTAGQGARVAAAVGGPASERYGRVRQALGGAAHGTRGAADREGPHHAGETASRVAEDFVGAVRDALHGGAAEAREAMRRVGGEATPGIPGDGAGTDPARREGPR
ncbi:hypothetical protein GCM10010964_34200 [Caldovatus sediminis]|uniref:Uncharacterized protein n=1 Tax=Caldovatus sediminis TaxID=2041189 RepID=A0A8J2ZDR6_9PROT|nr:hypothetical protein GCM10010964_34200 [Caldovatus sediminis]